MYGENLLKHIFLIRFHIEVFLDEYVIFCHILLNIEFILTISWQ